MKAYKIKKGTERFKCFIPSPILGFKKPKMPFFFFSKVHSVKIEKTKTIISETS